MRNSECSCTEHDLAPIRLAVSPLRNHFVMKSRLFLALALIALGMNAFIPAGYMLSPSSSHYLTVTLCPETHPLARAAMASDGHAQSAEAAAYHAAMGHHVPMSQKDTPSAGSADVDCAFSALALAGDIPDQPQADLFALDRSLTSPARLKRLALSPSRNLRPPLRGPPSHA
jgi:hypothetical protein